MEKAKEWLKSNAATIVLGILGCAGIVGSFFAGLATVIATDPVVFWIWSAAIAILFGAAGWIARSIFAKKELGMSVSEAMERLTFLQTQLDEDEVALLSMSDEAQLICMTAWNGVKRGDEVRMPLDQLEAIRGIDSVSEAEESPFVILARCGGGRVRIEATKRLTTLLNERPDVHRKLIETAIMSAPDASLLFSWKDISFINDERDFSLLPPEGHSVAPSMNSFPRDPDIPKNSHIIEQERAITEKLSGINPSDLLIVKGMYEGRLFGAIDGDPDTHPLITTGIAHVHYDDEIGSTEMTPGFRSLCAANQDHFYSEIERLSKQYYECRHGG